VDAKHVLTPSCISFLPYHHLLDTAYVYIASHQSTVRIECRYVLASAAVMLVAQHQERAPSVGT